MACHPPTAADCLSTITEFVDEVIEERQQKIAAEHGYEIVDHSLILYVKPLNAGKK